MAYQIIAEVYMGSTSAQHIINHSFEFNQVAGKFSTCVLRIPALFPRKAESGSRYSSVEIDVIEDVYNSMEGGCKYIERS